MMRSGVLAFLPVALGVLFACSTSTSTVDGGSEFGSPTDASALPNGVVPAAAGGYCCPFDLTFIPCSPTYLGGWSPTPERCNLSRAQIDSYPILDVTSSEREHGCPTYVTGGCQCHGVPCPALDASVDADASDAADAPLPD